MPPKKISELVMNTLSSDKEYSSSEFLEQMRKKGVNDADAREAVAFLLSDHKIRMTSKRKLTKMTA